MTIEECAQKYRSIAVPRNIARAWWCMKRVQTDPDVAVVLDALLEGASADRVRAAADASRGRVVVERPETTGLTAVLWDVPEGTAFTRVYGQDDDELRRRIQDDVRERSQVRRPLAVVACTEARRDSPLAGVGPVTERVFRIPSLQTERAGTPVFGPRATDL